MKRIIIFVFCLATLRVMEPSFAAAADPIPYNIAVQVSEQNSKETAAITVIGRSGYHINTLYPWKLTVKPTPGVVLDKKIYTKKDAAQFDEKKVVFSVTYINRMTKKMSAELKLGLCDARQCRSDKIPLNW